MTYVPKLPDKNVNVSDRHPLAELAWLLGGALGILLLAYLALGLAVDIAVEKMPPDFEAEHLSDFSIPLDVDEGDPFQDPTQEVLEKLIDAMPEVHYDFELGIVPGNEINAFALPGGGIVMMRGLLANADSENEVAMVLAHELGHFANRDHLRGLGRGLVIAVFSSLLFGQDTVGRVMGGTLNLAQMQHSRGQETAADVYGVALLNKAYGHVGGSTAFFERLMENDIPKSLAWMSTHPLSEKRIHDIRNEITTKGYGESGLLPWPPLE